jgi:ADP-heptose:LPS heptosyltransferase
MLPKKILIIRFSSIGDIVLTSPVIRCLKQQLNAEVHLVCKKIFSDTVIHNPHLDKLHLFDKDVSEIYELLKSEKYDIVIDLHKNLRSLRLKKTLRVKSYSYDKINFRKFLAVRFKMKNVLPQKHIVERYLDTVKPLGVVNDGKGLEYFISEADHVEVNTLYFKEKKSFVVLVAGGSYFTKQIPLNKLEEICSHLKLPIVILGGKSDRLLADKLSLKFPDLINLCGSLTLNQSASVISQANWVVSSDTGLMHIASAFNKPIFSFWGNTIPEFGMSPYLPNEQNVILEVKELGCRPCSKLGYHKCPRGHFRCMNEIDTSAVTRLNS